VYKILFAKEAQKTLLRLPKNTSALIRQKLEQLAADPYAPNMNALKLQNRTGYRLRIGDWRVIYEIQNNELVVLVLKIAQRGEVYR
jgi:mRNA interferase RelE/StbE